MRRVHVAARRALRSAAHGTPGNGSSVRVVLYSTSSSSSSIPVLDTFQRRHLGPREADISAMLDTLGFRSLEELTDAVVPSSIRFKEEPDFALLPQGQGESEAVAELREMMEKNDVKKSLIGLGFHGTVTPPVILRNVLENPGWYTPYTPYQAEISQGRMEMLLNYQTMVSDLTGLPLANASMLDEGSAAAEALSMCYAASRKAPLAFFVADDIHPTTLAVVRTRAKPLGFAVHVGDPASFDFAGTPVCGALLQYPGTTGEVRSDMPEIVARIKESGSLVVAATDLLALTVLKPPGEFGVDIAVGNSQRFGVPMGYGGPHAAFLATADTKMIRKMPGRIIGVSKDAHGDAALRMTLQTREQHIRREKATSNICTAQALLANMAASYAVYHGPKGLTAIAERTHRLAVAFAEGLKRVPDVEVVHSSFFDTVTVKLSPGRTAQEVLTVAQALGYNLRELDLQTVCVSFDETTEGKDVERVLRAFSGKDETGRAEELYGNASSPIGSNLQRSSPFLQHKNFNSYHSETEMLRYLFRLQSKDLGLNTAMIPLGSCTMKLNATSEMIPVTWPEVSALHPFVPLEQAKGYSEMCKRLSDQLARITGFSAFSLQPNAGSQGEYAGLRTIQAFHEANGEHHRNVCLIPSSAHGTNPASAMMVGLKVQVVKCDDDGYVNKEDLIRQAEKHSENLSSLMITYPSTYGVFEEDIVEYCDLIHKHGGQVYMDGANMNAQVGLTSPGSIGADVCHLNLHKTFCIPHGGGGPGVGPIGVASHLAPFLPSNPLIPIPGTDQTIGSVVSAPWGSAAILPISYMYLQMMGTEGLKKASQVAILNANYMKKRLEDHIPVQYKGRRGGMVAHEFIVDFSPWKKHGIVVEDVAKRLMDFSFHGPTMSWPVPDTLMIEPTESESKEELDRFIDALLHIRQEIQDVVDGKVAVQDSPLKHAPHTMGDVASDSWSRPYSREVAAFPAPYLKKNKFWPSVGRLDNVWGDRNIFCSCDGFDSVASEKE